MARVPRLVVLACTAFLGGCALARDTPPTVDVLDVRLTGIGLTEQRLSTTLCVTNPNADEIAFRRVAVTLDVSGSPLAEGSSDAAIRLVPLSSTAVPFTAVTTVRNLGPQVLVVLRSGSLDYRVHGTVSLAGALGLTLPFSKSGHLDLLTSGFELASAVGEATPTRCAR